MTGLEREPPLSVRTATSVSSVGRKRLLEYPTLVESWTALTPIAQQNGAVASELV